MVYSVGKVCTYIYCNCSNWKLVIFQAYEGRTHVQTCEKPSSVCCTLLSEHIQRSDHASEVHLCRLHLSCLTCVHYTTTSILYLRDSTCSWLSPSPLPPPPPGYSCPAPTHSQLSTYLTSQVCCPRELPLSEIPQLMPFRSALLINPHSVIVCIAMPSQPYSCTTHHASSSSWWSCTCVHYTTTTILYFRDST